MTIQEYIDWWEMTDTLSVIDYEVDDFDAVTGITVFNGFDKEFLP